MIQCKQIMTSNPIYCGPDSTVDEVARIMKEKDVGPVPVVDDMVLIGIVTDRDLALNVVANNSQPSKIAVSTVMSGDPICCEPETDIEDALELMETHKVRRLPVVDSQRKLVGIISQGDIATRLNWSDKTAQVVEEISKRNGTSIE